MSHKYFVVRRGPAGEVLASHLTRTRDGLVSCGAEHCAWVLLEGRGKVQAARLAKENLGLLRTLSRYGAWVEPRDALVADASGAEVIDRGTHLGGQELIEECEHEVAAPLIASLRALIASLRAVEARWLFSPFTYTVECERHGRVIDPTPCDVAIHGMTPECEVWIGGVRMAQLWACALLPEAHKLHRPLTGMDQRLRDRHLRGDLSHLMECIHGCDDAWRRQHHGH